MFHCHILEHQAAGTMALAGKPVRWEAPHQAQKLGIEAVLQVPRLADNLDVAENIFLGREMARTPLRVIDWERTTRGALAVLADFDLPPKLLHERVSNLSDEQRQLLVLARALQRPCRLLLLDDTLTALSYERQERLLKRIKQLADQGTAVIISSDNLKHLFAVTDRILVLYEGGLAADRRTADSTPRDIVELIVGSHRQEQVTPIIWALESYHAAQQQAEELRQTQATLRENLEARDSLNRQLVERLHDQVTALNQLNAALQAAQRRLMTEREAERKALARELHDQIIQDLLSFNYRLE